MCNKPSQTTNPSIRRQPRRYCQRFSLDSLAGCRNSAKNVSLQTVPNYTQEVFVHKSHVHRHPRFGFPCGAFQRHPEALTEGHRLQVGGADALQHLPLKSFGSVRQSKNGPQLASFFRFPPKSTYKASPKKGYPPKKKTHPTGRHRGSGQQSRSLNLTQCGLPPLLLALAGQKGHGCPTSPA